jgi:hypothetical protein
MTPLPPNCTRAGQARCFACQMRKRKVLIMVELNRVSLDHRYPNFTTISPFKIDIGHVVLHNIIFSWLFIFGNCNKYALVFLK